MRSPVHNFLDRLFQSDRAVGWKMLGGAIFTSALAVGKSVAGARQAQPPLQITHANLAAIGAGSAILGAYLVLVLSLRDEARRIEGLGERPGFLLRLHSGRGCLSWILYGTIALVLTLLIIQSIEGGRG